MIWVADIGNHVVMRFTPEGKLLKMLGTYGEYGTDRTHLNEPTDMVITPRGEMFVSDGYGNSRVVHFDAGGKFVKAWGTLGTRPGQFSLPHAVALDSKGKLYVADRNNARIQVFSPEGESLDTWPIRGTFNTSRRMVVDQHDRSHTLILLDQDASVLDWETALVAMLGHMVSDGSVPLTLEAADGWQRPVSIDVGDDARRLTEPGMLFEGLGFQPFGPRFGRSFP